MEDIINSMPEYCTDHAEPTWHLYHYWAYDDGTYSVCDVDGNHDPVEETDLPTAEEFDKAWRCYARWVVENGEDPLYQFNVKHATMVKERWWFRVNRSILGVVLTETKRGRHRYVHYELPVHVRQYLNLPPKSPKLADFKDWADFATVRPDVKPLRWFSAEIEHQQPRNPKAVARDLRRLARRNI